MTTTFTAATLRFYSKRPSSIFEALQRCSLTDGYAPEIDNLLALGECAHRWH